MPLKVPTTEAEFYAMFGKFAWTDLPSGAILPTDRKWAKNICKVAFGYGGVWAHRAVKADLEEIWKQWLALKHPYVVTRAESYCPRHQYWRAGAPLSIHSWGAAIDLNPLTNMPGTKGDLPKELVALFKAHGWRWGGDFKHKDPMHFQAYSGASF